MTTNNSVRGNEHLNIGGADTVMLAETYGTPLYAYDVSLMRERARLFVKTFEQLGVKAQVAYASKAFSCLAMCQLAKEENMSLDVVSGGELHTALRAEFPPEKIHFHGNNKSEAELRMALSAGIGCFVVDNFFEIEMLEKLCLENNQKTSILLRVSPGVEAHTHDYILTGQTDSKFGFDLINGQAEEALISARSKDCFEVLGVHCHIGSQIFETTGFVLAAEKIFSKLVEWNEKLGFFPKVLNLGGGFGIRYTDEDEPIAVSEYVEAIIQKIKNLSGETGLAIPEIWIEPGRSIVGDAGITLYQIGATKEIPNIRQYLAIDGGMSDNIRPALYDARYSAVIANRPNAPKDEVYTIAGKCCESGDMLIWDLPMPSAEPGEYLAVFSTGAYGYSMSNNYNRIPRPAVVFVENGEHRLVVKRESYEDLLLNDLPL